MSPAPLDNPSSLQRQDHAWSRLRLAVLVPCYNEEPAIAKVVADFRECLPRAVVYVYDNNSSDSTAAVARRAGAVVRTEMRPGKGSVIRRMFADVEADIYLLVDGDDTYQAEVAPEMVGLLVAGQLDMVNATRVSEARAAYRPGHRLGNAVLSGIVGQIFGDQITDMLSGYRVFSRRFVKSFPALSTGFETETELTVHALDLRMPVGEIEAAYRERPPGSASKLHTFADGLRILRTIILLVKEQRPLMFFSLAALALFTLGQALALPLVATFLRTGLVPRLPTAVLSTGLVLTSFLALACGLILDTVAGGRKEAKRLAYLTLPGIAVVSERLESDAAPTGADEACSDPEAGGPWISLAEARYGASR